jgi:hypothetical protein
MAQLAALKRAVADVALVVALTACSAAPAASPAPVVSPDAAPSAVATPSPSASEAAAAPTKVPEPSTPAKPRPSIDQADLEAFLTSSITLVKLADGDLAVTVAYIDTESDEAIDLGTYTLTSMDQQTNQVPPGPYRLEFRQPAAGGPGPACMIELDDDDAYTFGAVEGSIAIAKAGEAPSDAADLIVPTSSLCLG